MKCNEFDTWLLKFVVQAKEFASFLIPPNITNSDLPSTRVYKTVSSGPCEGMPSFLNGNHVT